MGIIHAWEPHPVYQVVMPLSCHWYTFYFSTVSLYQHFCLCLQKVRLWIQAFVCAYCILRGDIWDIGQHVTGSACVYVSVCISTEVNGHDSRLSLQEPYISLFSLLRESSPLAPPLPLFLPPPHPLFYSLSLFILLTRPLIPLAHRLQQRVLPMLKGFLAKSLIMSGTSSQSWTMVISIPCTSIYQSLCSPSLLLSQSLIWSVWHPFFPLKVTFLSPLHTFKLSLHHIHPTFASILSPSTQHSPSHLHSSPPSLPLPGVAPFNPSIQLLPQLLPLFFFFF